MTKKEQRRRGDIRQVIVDKIATSKVSTRSLKDPAQVRSYLQQYFASVPVEDIQGRSEKIMARIALDHLEFGSVRKDGEALVRVFNATKKTHGYESAFTFVETVNDDMPFLVDSLSATILQNKMAVHITVHPIIRVRRDKRGKIREITSSSDEDARSESFIRLAVDRISGSDELEALQKEIENVLDDVRLAVRDWGEMRQRMRLTRDLLEYGPTRADPLLRSESQALLDWMADDHFTFLGYREYALKKSGKRLLLKSVPGTGLGVLSRDDQGSKSIELTDEMKHLTKARDWLILTKANSRSTVHRSTYLDYVGVKVYNRDGKVVGERRFIGLLTSIAYSESPRNIPLLRHKVHKIYERTNVEPAGHRGKALLHIIETYPREELFQSSIEDLARTTLGILNLQDRQRVKLFLRRDPFNRFFSCLVFVPREKYTTAIRRQIEQRLTDAFGGTSFDSAVQISDSALARVHTIVRTPTHQRPRFSIDEIEQQIAELVITWSDRLRDELNSRFGQDEGERLYRQYRDVFPAGFQEDTLPS
ncbi:MAG: NAD-glutamate dehydrogenase, partial [Gammaproteobacteria bacterium]|nr:NAD-glutamate dehydrogenase [Gammaproteobacteria bacterium]